ncbi:MAG: carbohydrate-binding family 9-like protein [Dyadobacter sp.]
MDGKLDEKSWQNAGWTSSFVDIEGQKKPLPLQNTQVKMLWDKKYLYIAAVLDEEHIWAYQNKKDQIVYLENDFEVFIDPDNNTDNYYELEINALNNSFDLFLPKPYKKGGQPVLNWDIKNLRSAVLIEGTINDGTDKDKRWTLEIAIPFESLSTEHVAFVPPDPDKIWRINFSRVNWQHEIDSNGKYARKKNPETGKIVTEYNWAWSPQGVINMHVPEFWGFLQFKKQKVGKLK